MELISLPSLGLGTSHLLHHDSKADALINLNLAFDLGIVYYDTAPIYGYGWSEKILGTFTKHKREKILIATKIGLQPSRILSALPFSALAGLGHLARNLRRHRSQGNPIGVRQYVSQSFDPGWATQSLESSLKRLNTDYVDVLLLHEATIKGANFPTTKKFMQDAVQSGKVRTIGIGSSLNRLVDVGELDPSYTVVQHEYDIMAHQPTIPGNRVVNTHGLLQNMIRIKSLASHHALQIDIKRVCGLDISKENDVLHFCLAGARFEHTKGISLFSSAKPQRIKNTIAAWNNLSIHDHSFQEALALIRKQSLAL